MDGRKSELSVVPTKQGNSPHEDPVEGRESRVTELLEGKMPGISNSESVSTKLQQIANLARRMPHAALITLAHHIDHEFLVEAYRRTRRDGAAGIDGQTANQYASNLEANLHDLLARFKTGRYFAPPVRRVHIPKGDGSKTRPIGIPTFEDKVLQRAVAMVLEAVYEQDFSDCSFGFRPGRSAHQALDTLWKQLMKMRGGWVVEVDIQAFFDHLDHGQLRQILDQRVRDGVLRRAIDKWLKAGILEEGNLSYSEQGTPQGGVISPILANIYLHEVFDTWFEDIVRPRLHGKAFAIRYADDLAIVLSSERDVRRIMDVLPKRFGRYGLTLHPDKTRVVDFRRPPGDPRSQGEHRPTSFDLLGFTHHWAKSRKGKPVIKRRTMTSRFSRAMRTIAQWCKQHRHDSVADQHRTLSRKLRGHYAYYGIAGNSLALSRFYDAVTRVWQKWLNRRSQRAGMSWAVFGRLKRRYPLPRPRIVHRVSA